MTNIYVNTCAAKRVSRMGYNVPVVPSEIADRIEQILKQSKRSAREHSAACGLSPTTISTLLGRLRGGDPLAVELKTLAKIADGSGVSMQWLIFGEPAELHPERAAGAAEARRIGVKEEAIASVLREPMTPERAGHPARWWTLQMQLREVELLPPSGEIPRVQKIPPPRSSAPASGRRPSAPPDDPFAPDSSPASRAPVHESGKVPREIDPEVAQEITEEQRQTALAAAKKKAKS